MIISKSVLAQAMNAKTAHLNVVGLVEYRNANGQSNLLLVSETGGKVPLIRYHIIDYHFSGQLAEIHQETMLDRAWQLFRREMDRVIPCTQNCSL